MANNFYGIFTVILVVYLFLVFAPKVTEAKSSLKGTETHMAGEIAAQILTRLAEGRFNNYVSNLDSRMDRRKRPRNAKGLSKVWDLTPFEINLHRITELILSEIEAGGFNVQRLSLQKDDLDGAYWICWKVYDSNVRKEKTEPGKAHGSHRSSYDELCKMKHRVEEFLQSPIDSIREYQRI